MSRILVAEDEAPSAAAVRAYLERLGHQVRLWPLPIRELDLVEEFRPDVVLCDWLLGPGMDGVELAERLRAAAPEVRFVLMTGMPSSELEDRLTRVEVCRVVYKPLCLSDLETALGLGSDPAAETTATLRPSGRRGDRWTTS